jgi:hypothetical protein
MSFRLFTFFGLAVAVAGSCVLAQSAPNPSPVQPVVANLMSILDSSQAKAGKKFHAYVLKDWTDGQCTLHRGASLDGHISQVDRRTKAQKNGALHLVVDSAECQKHHSTPVHMVLVALLGPDDPTPGGESGVGKNPELSDQPLAIQGLRSAEAAAYNYTYALTGRSLPTTWSPGMVLYLPATSLKVGGGAEGGSVVTKENKDVLLPAGTLLILSEVR